MGGNSSSNGGGEGPANRYQKPPAPKKSITTKIKDGASAYVKARRKQAYTVANIVPGMQKGLVKNRTDYKDYLKDRGNTPDFLNVDDKTLGSFDTYEQVRNYEPTQRGPNSNTLNYADYLAQEKGNFNLKNSGNVGNSNNNNSNNNNSSNNNSTNNQIKPITLDSATYNSPTKAEVSQATTADANLTDNIETRKKKTKAKGRSMTILSSSKGVTSDENLILGKKSLLGS